MKKLILILSSIVLSVFIVLTIYFLIKNNVFRKDPQNFNLILISVDTFRSDHIGSYGYKKNTTPNIDMWAKDAMVFTNAYTTVPITFPSFISLMTGQHPLSMNIFTNELSDKGLLSSNNKTLAKMLHDNNYVTAAFFRNGALRDELTNLGQGFDEYVFDKGWSYSDIDYGDLKTNVFDWLDTNRKNKFFLWIHLVDPHAPYEPPDKFKCTFNKDNCDYINSKSLYLLENERRELQGCSLKDIPKDKVSIMETLYDGEIAQSDSLIGEIFQKINASGLDKKSIVMLYGDHGEGFDHNYFFSHGDVLYNSSVKIPLIIKYPPITKGSVNNLLIKNSDIFPTLLDLLDVSRKDLELNGESFIEQFKPTFANYLIKNKQKPIYFVNKNMTKYAILQDSYKYILSLDKNCFFQNADEELYDISKDPYEKNNILLKQDIISNDLRNKLLNKLAVYNLPKDFKYAHDKEKTIRDQIIDNLKSLGY